MNSPAGSFGIENRQTLLLVSTGIVAALLTGLIAGLFGGAVALLALLLVLFMAVAIADYRAGILVAIVLLPLSATNLLPRELFGITGFNPLNATLLMATLSILFMVLFHRGDILVPKYPRYFWVYLAALALAAVHGAFHASSIPAYYKALQIVNFDTPAGYVRDIFLKPLLIVVTAFMLSIAVRNARRPAIFLLPLFGSAMILPIATIAYLAFSGSSLTMLASSEARGTLSVLGMHANELGLMFNMAFALALFCFTAMSAGFGKWLMGTAIIVIVAATVLTFSRGAYLGLLAVLAYFLYTRKKFSIMLLGLVLVPATILLLPQAVVERATMGARDRNVDTITAGRLEGIWRPLLPEVESSPIVGNGLSSILWSHAAQRGAILKVGHPHSAYLGVLLDLGVAGALVIFLFFRHMRRLFSMLMERSTEPIWRGFFRGATACILLLLVQGLTDDRFTPTFPQTFLWLAYGMALGLAARTSSELPPGAPGRRDAGARL
jgi:O-antigen ligase